MTEDLLRASGAVRFARDQGVVLWTEEGRLRFRSTSPLPTDLAGLLSRLKTSIIAFLADSALEKQCRECPPNDAWDLREERAAILEYEAGFTRAEAEARSLSEPA